MAAMWAEAVYSRVARLERAIDQFQSAVADEHFRQVYDAGDDPARQEAWREEYERSTRRLTPRITWGVGLAKYELLHVAAQLDKCIGLLPDDDLLPFENPTLLRKLRDFDEHWEDPEGRAGTWLEAEIPDFAPGQLAYTKKWIWIEGIEIGAIWDWAREVDRRIREIAEKTDHPIPPSEWAAAFRLFGRTLGEPIDDDEDLMSDG
jgi:hypothetical protein